MKLLNRIRRKVRSLGTRALYEPAYWRLARTSGDDMARFNMFRQWIPTLYDLVSTAAESVPTTQLWTDFNSTLEHSLLPDMPYSFLRNNVISATMVMTRGGKLLHEQLAYLEARFPSQVLTSLLRESAVGHPQIANWKYMSSHNSIHHTYHLARFFTSTGVLPDSLGNIVEWGGGYGNFAKIVSRFSPVQRQYIIIDTPILCVLQWLYLSSVLPEVDIQLIQNPHEQLRGTGIVIIPAQWYALYTLSPDLFISTWALSESPVETQINIGSSRNWFGAKHLLLAYQDSNLTLLNADTTGRLAHGTGARIEYIPYLPENHYAFR